MIELEGEPVNLSLTTFVDDIGEIVILDSVADAHAKCEYNTKSLKKCLAEAGCALEPTKEVVVARWFGRGGQNQIKEYTNENVITSGSKKDVARYLGAWPQDNNSVTYDIKKHIQAMLTGFYTFYGIWGSTRVPEKLQKLFFTAIVTSAGLSGLEPFALPSTQVKKLESVHISVLRRMCGKEGWGKTKHDTTHRAVSNEHISRKANVRTFESILRKRRRQWFRQILRQPEYRVQYLASLFGKFPWEPNPELEDGKPHKNAIYPFIQLYKDLSIAYPGPEWFQGFRRNWMELIVKDEGVYDNVLSYKEEDEVQNTRHPDSIAVQSEEGFVEDVVGYEKHQCPTCSRKLMSWQARFNIDVQLIFTKQLRGN